MNEEPSNEGALRVVLVSSPARPAVDEAALGAIAALLPADATPTVLAPGIAASFETAAPAGALDAEGPKLAQRCRQALAGRPVDIVVLKGPARRARLLVADMESTIIEQEMLDELADEVGLRERISAITERAMRGELDFEAALTERVGLLKGLEARVLDEVYRRRVTLMPGARTLVATMARHGAKTALVSGGFTVFTERVASELHFDVARANRLEVEGGRLTGRVVPPILGREAKRESLSGLAREGGIELSDTIAVGDGSNDVAMLERAGVGVAFRGKPKVREAMGRLPTGAVIDHGDLTALLYIQGFRERDLVG